MSEIPSASPEPEDRIRTGSATVNGLPKVPMMTHEEAEALRTRTLKQERTSAILVAVLIHALIIAGLALWGLGVLESDGPETVTVTRLLPPDDDDNNNETEKTSRLQQKPAAPSPTTKFINSTVARSAVFVPDVPMVTDALEMGNSVNLGLSFGDGDLDIGDGDGDFENLPPEMRGRCTLEERMKRLTEGGGTKECEEAVVKSLTWLQLHQNADGSWGRQKKVAMTGLAVLAYLGHCETPKSATYGETVFNGIVYLIDQGMKNDGYFLENRRGHHWVYEHAIGVYALGEAYAFVSEMDMDIPNLREVLEKGTDIIIAGQHTGGGWDYHYDKTGNRGGDTSVVGWQMQALKAAQNAGYGKTFGEEHVLMRAVKAGWDYIVSKQNDVGSIGYTGKPGAGKETYGLTGVGALSFQMFGKEGRVVRNALKVARNMPFDYDADNANIYAWYYTTQAMFLKGGAYWEDWNEKFRDEILENQRSDGAWQPEGGSGPKSSRAAGQDAQIYLNCLNTLMLEVYYRYLPGTGG